MATGRFRRTDRLLDGRDFRRVLRRGRRRAHPDVVVLTCGLEEKTIKNGYLSSDREFGRESGRNSGRDSGDRRLGITASRRVGNAVRRNRFKRRVREWFRRRRWELEPGLDVVVIARKSGARLGAAELDERLSYLLGLEGPTGGRER